jgi:hypothetical protein
MVVGLCDSKSLIVYKLDCDRLVGLVIWLLDVAVKRARRLSRDGDITDYIYPGSPGIRG